MKNSKPDGIHYLISIYGCDQSQINSLAFWKKVLPSAVACSKMTVLYDNYYEFSPCGITGFLLLSSSHVSIHTWPECDYVACDVFSCSDPEDTKKVVEYLREHIIHTKFQVSKEARGYTQCSLSTRTRRKKIMGYLVSPIFSTGGIEKIKVSSTLEKIHSHFQMIEIIDTPKFGKCLVIDGLVQTGETDHEIYDRAILKRMTKDDRQVIILGGGDGYVAETGLKINPDANFTVAELDMEVIKACEKHLGQKVFYHSNVKLMVGDALHFLKVHDELGNPKADGIVCDLTDNPVGGRENEEEFRSFYGKVLELASKIIRPGGWISVQAGASKVTGEYLNAVAILEELMKNHFSEVFREDVLIPSYSESEAFLYGKKKP